MNTYRTVLVEDTPDDQAVFRDYTARVPFLNVAAVFGDPLEALPFLLAEPVDLLFLDHSLPGLSGPELLRSLPDPPPVVMTTVSLTDALEAYELGIADYLVKPFAFERFLRAVNRAVARRETFNAATLNQPPSIFLKSGHESVRVHLNEIRFIEATGQLSRVYLKDSILTVSHLLVELAERLPPARFMRIHRSYIVALPFVTRYSNRSLSVGPHELPVGPNFQTKLRSLLE